MNGSLGKFLKEHHAVLLLFWPIDLIAFFVSEKLAVGRAYVIHSVIDDMIPFCDFFVIFYVLWYPAWVLMLLYSFIWEPETFRRTMMYYILTMTICNIFYFAIPTAIDFQPDYFENDNILTKLMGVLYYLDEPTNVFPSEHVIGAFAIFFGAFDSKRFGKAKYTVPFFFLSVLISVSILFTKQHSFWDLVATVPLCFAAWLLCFSPWKRNKTIAGQ